MTAPDLWTQEKQKALQLGVALQIYRTENEPTFAFPDKMEEALSLFEHDKRFHKRLVGMLMFEDPHTKLKTPWIYNKLAVGDSSDLLIASPESPGQKRVVLLCDGVAVVIGEQAFKRRFGQDDGVKISKQ